MVEGHPQREELYYRVAAFGMMRTTDLGFHSVKHPITGLAGTCKPHPS